MRALSANGVTAAERAVQLLPNDAEVHAARGVVLQRTENYADAVRELERAVQLRPRDYFLWMMLGVTRDLNDDQQGGLAALRESIRLAPGYAKPRWLAGNLLLRTGQVEEAFQQMRFAEERDSGLLPNVIDLAWGTAQANPAKTVAMIQPQTDRAYMALAIFLASHKEGAAALEQFRFAGSPAAGASDQLTQRLIAEQSFVEAYEVWTKAHCSTCKTGSFINGSFEDDIDVGNRTFGWQIPSEATGVTLSVDTNEHQSGGRSLRIDFRGNINPQSDLLSQVVTVEPGSRYRVSFLAMTKSFVSVASPVVRVIDASSEKPATLGEAPVRLDESAWHSDAAYFSTGPNTRAVRVLVNWANCPNNPCAAFGTIWFDSFLLEQSNETK